MGEGGAAGSGVVVFQYVRRYAHELGAVLNEDRRGTAMLFLNVVHLRRVVVNLTRSEEETGDGLIGGLVGAFDFRGAELVRRGLQRLEGDSFPFAGQQRFTASVSFPGVFACLRARARNFSAYVPGAVSAFAIATSSSFKGITPLWGASQWTRQSGFL